jgi:hypothetical protein
MCGVRRRWRVADECGQGEWTPNWSKRVLVASVDTKRAVCDIGRVNKKGVVDRHMDCGVKRRGVNLA